MRIVSLIPSATEIVAALGLADSLVGRSHECDFPAGVERLPALTEPKRPLDGDAGAIDRDVRALLAEGLAVYRVDAERLRELRPDVVVTQAQCDVCAVSLRDVEAALETWVGTPARVVSLAPSTLRDVFSDVRRVAEALGVPERGEALATELEARVEAITARARRTAGAPRVAAIEWTDPLMGAGNWVPELVERAGGIPVLGRAGEHSGWIEMDDLRRAAPEVIVGMPCGFDLERTRVEMASLARQPGWDDLPAVREGRVLVVDGNQYFNRPGPRLVESLEILAEILHPGELSYGHEGRGWQQAVPGRPRRIPA